MPKISRSEILLTVLACGVGYAALEVAAPLVAPDPASVADAAAEVPTDGLVCLDPVYDFGRVDTGRPLTHTFWLKNLSDRPARVLQIKTSCACTSTSKPEGEVGLDKSVGIDVTVDWRGKGGQQLAAVWIRTDDPDAAMQTLSLYANASPVPSVVPERVTRHKTGEDGPVILIQGAERPDFRITSVVVPPGVRLCRLDPDGLPRSDLSLSGSAGRFRVTWLEAEVGRDARSGSEQIVFATNDESIPALIVTVYNP